MTTGTISNEFAWIESWSDWTTWARQTSSSRDAAAMGVRSSWSSRSGPRHQPRLDLRRFYKRMIRCQWDPAPAVAPSCGTRGPIYHHLGPGSGRVSTSTRLRPRKKPRTRARGRRARTRPPSSPGTPSHRFRACPPTCRRRPRSVAGRSACQAGQSPSSDLRTLCTKSPSTKTSMPSGRHTRE